MRKPRRWIIASTVLALALVILIPPWQQKYKGTRLAYSGELGHHLLWAPPKPTGEHSWMVHALPSQCEVVLEPGAMLRQSVAIIAAAAILFFVFRPGAIANSPGSEVKLARRGWLRIFDALGIGFAIELSLMSIPLGTGDPYKSRSAWWVLKWTQEPGSHVAASLVTSLHLGFEEGIGWFLLIFPVVQAIFYSLVVYVALVILGKKLAPAQEHR